MYFVRLFGFFWCLFLVWGFLLFKQAFTKLQINVRKSLTFSFVFCPATSVPLGTGTAPGSSKHHNISSTCLDFAAPSGRSSFSSFSSSLKKGGACTGFTFCCKIKRILVNKIGGFIRLLHCCGIKESQFAFCRSLGHWKRA